MRSVFPAKGQVVFRLVIISLVGLLTASAQEAPKAGPGVGDNARTHRRIDQTPIAGRRVQLRSLNGAQLFVGPGIDTTRPVPLIIHFHGAAWLIEAHISRSVNAVLITVNLGAGSSVYGRPFESESAFTELIAEAKGELDLRKGWSSITLSGFSAGYGAIRAILRHQRNFVLVNNVLLLDGIHADYVPEGRKLSDGGSVDTIDVDAFIKFAAEAVKGKKNFVITHSQIVPGTYASTTECVDHLLERIGLSRKPASVEESSGMRLLSRVDRKGLHIRGYAGDTAPDHVDHLHAMSGWFGLLGLKAKN